jgi:hypothetical protein
MAFLQTLSTYLPSIDSRSASQIEQDIVDELEFHIAMLTEDNMNRGMSPDPARAAALTQFGDFAAVQEKCRRALLGTRIMWQRIQLVLSAALLAAVAFLAFELFSNQRANQAAIEKITSSLNRVTPPSVVAQVQGEKPTDDSPAAAATNPDKSYAIELKPDSVCEFATLSVDFGKLKLKGKAITVVPIWTAVGVTGAVLLGQGEYSYVPTVGKTFTGHFRAAMLRFNPKDADAIIKLANGKALADKGAVELARAVVNTVFRHCYHAGQEALIPPEQAIAADVYSQELGEVLMSGDESMGIVFDFASRKQLYPEQ